MDVQTVITGARDAMSVRHVYGEPYVRDGLTVIPAAKVFGGAGGGDGQGPEGTGGQGSGSGFGLMSRPVGAFVIKGDEVAWRPAVDVNRIIIGAQVVAVVAMLTLRSIARARARPRARRRR
jgi:uncharacterized spore protein YtfJ